MVSDTRSDSITILSIFASIVLFGIGNIQLFTRIQELRHGLLFMLCFAFGLSTFIMLIWIITRRQKEQKNGFKIAVLLLFIACFSILLYILSWGNPPSYVPPSVQSTDTIPFKI
ncbi:MAG: hypothetical protein V4642_13110 [Bacteroidota bacterium]